MQQLPLISGRLPQTPGFSPRLPAARRAVVTATAIAAFLVACGGERDDAVPGTARGAPRPAASVDRDTSSVSDASILILIDRANVADSAAAVIAASKATSSDLRSFAARMVRDHHVMRVEGERVARRLRLTPDAATGSDGSGEMASILSVLTSTDRGRDFDKAYIDHEVAFHLDFLETVTGSMQLAGETEVKAYIQKLAPMLEEHLDLAQALQARLR